MSAMRRTLEMTANAIKQQIIARDATMPCQQLQQQQRQQTSVVSGDEDAIMAAITSQYNSTESSKITRGVDVKCAWCRPGHHTPTRYFSLNY